MGVGTMRRIVTIAVLGLLSVVLPTVAAGAQDVPMCNGLPATIVGTEGPDNLVGTSGRDVIVGLGGNDVIRGLAGADTICGGPGRDRILGGKQADVILGGDDGDKLFGDAGQDSIYGERGNDLLIGGQGDDVLDGGRGRRDRLRGRSGLDTCVDEQGSTSFDTNCLAGPAGGPVFQIDECFTDAEPFEVIASGRVTSTSNPTIDYNIDVDARDSDGAVLETNFTFVSDLRAGETARWEITSRDGVSGVDRCEANYEAIEPFNVPGDEWGISLDTCGVGQLDQLVATGSGTSPSNQTEDIFVLVHVIGNDGIRYAPSPIDFVEGIAPGAPFEFNASGFPPAIDGIVFCDVFVSVSTI